MRTNDRERRKRAWADDEPSSRRKPEIGRGRRQERDRDAGRSRLETGEMAPERRRRRRRKKKSGRIKGILFRTLLLLALLAGVGIYYVGGKLSLVQRLPWNQGRISSGHLNLQTAEQMKGFWQVAVFGVDSRDNSLGKGNNADVNMVVTINHDTGDIRIASIFRDTYMCIDGKNYNKLNASYLKGGPEQAVAAMNMNFDLNITEYATFNWKAVAEAINLLGGIDLEITDAEFEYMNAFIAETVKATGLGSHELKSAGMNHLDGIQAVAYGRLRLMDSDFKRTERQRKVIALSFEKMKKADLKTLNQIVQTVFPEIATSVDMGDLLRMAGNISRYHLTETYGFPEDNGLTRIKGRGSVVVPRTLESNVIKLHKFLFDDSAYQASSKVREISGHLVDVSGLGETEEAQSEEETVYDELKYGTAGKGKSH